MCISQRFKCRNVSLLSKSRFHFETKKASEVLSALEQNEESLLQFVFLLGFLDVDVSAVFNWQWKF